MWQSNMWHPLFMLPPCLIKERPSGLGRPSNGVAALGNRYVLKPQSIGSCVSTLLFRGFGVLRLDNCSDARAGARAGAGGARAHGVLIRLFPPRRIGVSKTQYPTPLD